MKKALWILLMLPMISCNNNANKKNEETAQTEEPQEVQAIKAEENESKSEGEKFEEVDPSELNQLLAEKEEELSAQEVMKLFYPYEPESEEEGNETIEITETTSDNGNTIVTLIHDGLMDDSLMGEKYIMELTKVGNKWKALSIKKNWKCWEGRGHTDWGIDSCI